MSGEALLPSLKRRLANWIERKTNYLILHEGQAHLLPERLHLRRFFEHFEVDCVFDVGANVGQYALELREGVGFSGPIISYEPIPELAARLREIGEGDPQWHVEALALDREAGPATFHVMAADVFSSLNRPAEDQPAIFEGMNRVARQIEVMRSTLAIELPRWREKLQFRRPFLKMRTQGSDLAVVEGAGDSIAEFVGLQSELAVRKIYTGGSAFAEMLSAYSARGFELSAFAPNTAGHFPILVETDCIMFRRDAPQAPPSAL
jgi:FkbM family methyltransferase